MAVLLKGRIDDTSDRVRLARSATLLYIGWRMSDGDQVKIEDLLAAAQEAERKKDWALALRHCDSALAAFPDHRLIHSLAPIRGRALIRFGRHAEAGAVFRSLMEAAPDRPAGLVGLAQLAQAQEDWSLALQRWDSCIESFPNSPQNQKWRGWRARTHEALGAWQDAFDAWNALAQACDGDREALVGRARCFLKLEGPVEEAEQFVVEALKSFPRDPASLRMHAVLAGRQDDTRLLLNRWMAYVALQPKADIDAYRKALLFAIQCGDRESAASVIELTPEKLASVTAYRCRVLLTFYESIDNIDAGLELVRDVQNRDLDAPDAMAISRFLLKALRHEEAINFLATAIKRFDDTPPLVGDYLRAVHASWGLEGFEAEKARLCRELGDLAAAQLLTSLPKSWLTPSELMVVIDKQLSTIDMNSSVVFSLLNIVDTNDRDVTDLLSQRLDAHEGPYVRVVRRIVKSKIRDSRRVAGGATGHAEWDAFQTESRSLAADLDELVGELIGTIMSSGEFGAAAFADAVSALKRIGPQAGAAWLNSSASYYDAASFAAWFGDRIARREPTSVIRLGDGEGNFLPYPASYADYQCRDRVEIQQQMWGGEFFSNSEAERFTQELASVAVRADAVGLSTMNRLLKVQRRASRGFSRVMRGWHNGLHFFDGVASGSLGNKIVVSSNYHSDWNGWAMYSQVLGSISKISTVSCHDLSTRLAEEFGLAVRSWHRIPAQKKHLGVFGHDDPAERFYPDIFNRIMAEIDPEPGEVFLVAAGLLGKFMCDRVRAKGGIALDIGSLADYWMGYSTREYGGAQLTLDAPSP